MTAGSRSVAVSVVIPCYRSAATIRRAVESVREQSAPPEEIILVEDASGDGTLDALRALAAETRAPSVKVIAMERNSGPGAARNRGWQAATQPYLAFLDHDDTWHPRKLELQHGWMAQHPEAMLSSHLLVRQDAPMQVPTSPDAERVTPARLLASNRFQTSSVMLRRELPFRFDESRRCLEDYLLWLEIVLSGHPGYQLQAPLGVQHKAVYGEAGLSARLWWMEKAELEALRRVRRERLIGAPAFAFASLLSLAKFARRAALTAARRLSS